MSVRRCARCGVEQPINNYAKKPENHLKRRGICNTCEPPPSDRMRAAMCSTKVRYKTQARALGVAQNAAKRVPFMRVYECPLCKGWHLTHKAATPTPPSPPQQASEIAEEAL